MEEIKKLGFKGIVLILLFLYFFGTGYYVLFIRLFDLTGSAELYYGFLAVFTLVCYKYRRPLSQYLKEKTYREPKKKKVKTDIVKSKDIKETKKLNKPPKIENNDLIIDVEVVNEK